MVQNSPQCARKRAKKTPSEKGLATASRLCNRLQRFIQYTGPATVPDPEDTNPDPDTGPRRIPAKQMMSDTQVRACLGLLKKYMPDLKSIELVGNADHPVVHRIERVIVDPHTEDTPSIPAAADPE